MHYSELHYVGLIFALFVIPRLLMRYGVPAAISALVFGAIAGLGFGIFVEDTTIQLLSTFGIVSLFLFAGLEVDIPEIRANKKIILQHVVIGVAILSFMIWALDSVFGLGFRASCILALAMLTPSAGFILDTIDS